MKSRQIYHTFGASGFVDMNGRLSDLKGPHPLVNLGGKNWIHEELAGCNSTTSFKMVPKMDREVEPELYNIPVAAADHQRIVDDHCGGEMGIAPSAYLWKCPPRKRRTIEKEMFEGQTQFGSVPLPDVNKKQKNCQCGSDHGYYNFFCQVAVLSALSGFVWCIKTLLCHTVELQGIGH